MGQHIGDLVVNNSREITDQVTGVTYVKTGGRLVVHGQIVGKVLGNGEVDIAPEAQIIGNDRPLARSPQTSIA